MALPDPFEPQNFTLVANTWTKAYDRNSEIESVKIANTSAADTVRFMYPEKDNPFAINFDGAASEVDISAIVAKYSQMRRAHIVIKARVDAVAGAVRTLFGTSIAANAGDYIRVYLDAAGQVLAEGVDSTVTQWQIASGFTVTLQKWHIIELIHDGAQPRLRIDGVIYPDFSISVDKEFGLTHLAFDDARIGAVTLSAAQADFFDGQIDLVYIYQGVDGKLPLKEGIAFYEMDEGTGTTVGDSSDNSFDGTLTAGGGGFVGRSPGTFLGTESVETINAETFIKGALWLLSTGTPTVNVVAKRA